MIPKPFLCSFTGSWRPVHWGTQSRFRPKGRRSNVFSLSRAGNEWQHDSIVKIQKQRKRTANWITHRKVFFEASENLIFEKWATDSPILVITKPALRCFWVSLCEFSGRPLPGRQTRILKGASGACQLNHSLTVHVPIHRPRISRRIRRRLHLGPLRILQEQHTVSYSSVACTRSPGIEEHFIHNATYPKC